MRRLVLFFFIIVLAFGKRFAKYLVEPIVLGYILIHYYPLIYFNNNNFGEQSTMTTIKKVCQLAGVSTATVSRALKSPELVTEKTRNKVLKAIEQAGYRPNMMAASVKTGKSNALLVLVPKLTNAFHLKIVQGIESAAQKNGYSVLIGDTQGQPKREHEYASMVLSNRADGLINLDHTFPFSKTDTKLAQNIPMVSVCQRIPGEQHYPVIEIDNYAACRALAKHLIDYGHKSFGVITGPNDSHIFTDRLAGIKSAFAEEDIEFKSKIIAGGDYSIDSGVAGAKALLSEKDRPTAIFCFNDDIAIGAIHQIKNHGLRVPEDISVVGFDNIEVTAFMDPSLTTIDQPAHEMGGRAVDVLLQLINKQPLKRNRELFPFKMVERASSSVVRSF